MHNYQTLIEKAKNGFDTLDLPINFKTDALDRLRTWLTDDMFAAYGPQIDHFIASGQWEFLLDAFYQVIPFGTGGRRGLVGIGPNRINPWTIQASAQGHSQYLIKTHGDAARQRGLVLAYDVRRDDPYLVYDQLDFEVKILGEPDVTAEYLYWVGCAGSFDDRNRKVTLSIARLLHEAEVDFAILGPQELCTGDPARRTGNEYVFQGLALQNIETLNDFGVTKIITQCPHCFNTLANEYPQFGGDYEVMHHSELLMQLVEDGRLQPKSNGQTVTFHDPCYLGRHNHIYEAPRRLLQSIPGLTLIEMAGNRENSLCCGGGGGGAWSNVPPQRRTGVLRIEEALSTGAEVIATACPYCIRMLSEAVRQLGVQDQIVVRDLAELLLQSVMIKDEALMTEGVDQEVCHV